jgi:ABC-type glycerol-3-phosphate transport system permease component
MKGATAGADRADVGPVAPSPSVGHHLLRGRAVLARAAVYASLALMALAVLYPLAWVAAASLKTDADLFQHPFGLPHLHHLQWGNFGRAWITGHFGDYFFNSVVVTIITVTLTTLLSAMAAYALSRFQFRFGKPIFYLFLAGLMLPLQQVIIPLFFEMRDLHLLNTRLGLILAYLALGLPFGIFVMTGFFKTLPASVYESALVDGAGELRAFWSIMLPIARPGLMTVAIFSFLGIWNEYLVAFMLISGKGSASLRTLPLGLANMSIAGQYRSDWGMAFAGLVLMLTPTLAVCLTLQKYITKGLTAGAVKG